MAGIPDWLGKDAFAGSRVLVTGGANGIGGALVDLIVRHGGRVAVLDRETGSAGDGAERKLFQADVINIADVNRAVTDAAQWLGGIDMVANVAGISRDGALASAEWDDLRGVLDINLFGPLHVCRAAFPFLRESKIAAIVNIGSVAAVQVYAGGGLYGASKAGLTALSYQMAIEWAPFGIRVNVCNPGPIETKLATKPLDPAQAAARTAKYPLRRRGTPMECANAIAFLLLPASSYITAQTVMVSGGLEQTATAGRAWWQDYLSKMTVGSQPLAGEQ
jgi:NAD(P)-dependent dehydrogenase (short-subunit alcohol dehydrogenase family)